MSGAEGDASDLRFIAGQWKSLKEQDSLISLIQHLTTEPSASGTVLDVRRGFSRAEALIREHIAAKREDPDAETELQRLAPDLQRMHVDLPMAEALEMVDAKTAMASRLHVPPSFSEIRRVLNTSVILAVSGSLELVTFDADETIYPDGSVLTADSPACTFIVDLLKQGLRVALCTAAGYKDAEKYQTRLRGLLDRFAESDVDAHMLSHFAVMGGECNYLLLPRCGSGEDGCIRVQLDYVPEEKWKNGRGVRWDHGDVASLLDRAQEALEETAQRLRLSTRMLRKDRAVGLIQANPERRFSYEVLEEIALSVQDALKGCVVPHCAFNGGNDVWVDVGHKALGIRALQAYFGVAQANTVHIGDRFTKTGNDRMAREVANTVWVAKPRETTRYVRLLLEQREKREEA